MGNLEYRMVICETIGQRVRQGDPFRELAFFANIQVMSETLIRMRVKKPQLF